MHLGPSAHRLMAMEIYHGIDGKLLNHTEAVGMPEGSESGSGPGPGSESPEPGSESESPSESTSASESESVSEPPAKRHTRRGSAA